MKLAVFKETSDGQWYYEEQGKADTAVKYFKYFTDAKKFCEQDYTRFTHYVVPSVKDRARYTPGAAPNTGTRKRFVRPSAKEIQRRIQTYLLNEHGTPSCFETESALKYIGAALKIVGDKTLKTVTTNYSYVPAVARILDEIYTNRGIKPISSADVV